MDLLNDIKCVHIMIGAAIVVVLLMLWTSKSEALSSVGYRIVDKPDMGQGAKIGVGPAWMKTNLVGFERADETTYSQVLGRTNGMEHAGNENLSSLPGDSHNGL